MSNLTDPSAIAPPDGPPEYPLVPFIYCTPELCPYNMSFYQYRIDLAPNAAFTAIFSLSLLGFLAVFGNYLLPEKIFTYLLSTSGAIALIVYLVIAATQLRSRAAMNRIGARPAVRMWGFPVLTYITMAFIVFTIVAMALREDQRLNLWLTLGLAAVVIGIGIARYGAKGGSEEAILEAVEASPHVDTDTSDLATHERHP